MERTLSTNVKRCITKNAWPPTSSLFAVQKTISDCVPITNSFSFGVCVASLFRRQSIQVSFSWKKTQSCCHRLICGGRCSCNCFASLTLRFEKLTLNLFFRIARNPSHPLHYLIPPILPSRRMHMPLPKTVRRRKTFKFKNISLLNALKALKCYLFLLLSHLAFAAFQHVFLTFIFKYKFISYNFIII